MSDNEYKDDLNYIEDENIRIKRMDDQSKQILYENEQYPKTQKEIEEFVSNMFLSFNIDGKYSIPNILQNLSYIEDTDSPNFESLINEMMRYDFPNQLINCYLNINDPQISLKCLSTLSVFLLNAPSQINSDIYEFTFQKIFDREEENQNDDEFVLLLNLLTSIVNIETIPHFKFEDCSHLFSFISNIENDTIISSFLSFVFKFYNSLNEQQNEQEFDIKILLDFTNLYIQFVKSNPIYCLKNEKVLIIRYITEMFHNIEGILQVNHDVIPFLLSMGSDVYFNLFSILIYLPLHFNAISICASSLFDSIISSFPENALIPGIALMDKIICSDSNYFNQLFFHNDESRVHLLAASLVQQILKSDAKNLIFSGRMLCLIVINFPSKFLIISHWMSKDDESGFYNLAAAFNRILEYGTDISDLAAGAIQSLFHHIQIENPDSIESFIRTMEENGIISSIQNQIDLCDDSEDQEILEEVYNMLTSQDNG